MPSEPTAPRPSGTTLQVLAVTLTGATIAIALTSLLLGPGSYPLPNVVEDPAAFGPWTLVLGLAYGVSGLLVATERPRSPIGWILLASALLGALSEMLGIYGVRALADPSVSWPFGLLSIWAAGWLWFPSLTLPFVVLPQVYPDGRPVGPLWRWPLRLSLLGILAVVVLLATAPDNVDDYVSTARLPITWPSWAQAASAGALVLAFVGVVGGLVAGGAGLFLRFRRGGPQERGQVLWLAIPILIGGATVFTPMSDWTVRLVYPAVAVAVAIGVIGFDLLGINVTVRQVLVYLPLTLAIALVVGTMTAVIGQWSAGSQNGVLVAAVAVAVLVLPLRDLLMRGADRLLYGRRSDPLAVMGRLGSVDAGGPGGLLSALAESVHSPGIALRDRDGHVIAQVGSTSDRAQSVPLQDGGQARGVDDVGDLLVTPRRGERRLDPNDARLLASVAPYVAAAVRAQALAGELEAERTRVVAATESERARLRRDLHDGLGPALSGIALGAEAVERLVDSDPAAARALAERLAAEAAAATEEVRRVIEDLRPTALDTAPLSAAIRRAAERVAPRVEVHAGDAVDAAGPDVAAAAYRIAAEALTNVARHSGAQACHVHLGLDDGRLVMSIRDDGAGLPGGAGDGVGLESMRRRARALGGEVTISRVDPVGTEVLAELPLRTEAP